MNNICIIQWPVAKIEPCLLYVVYSKSVDVRNGKLNIVNVINVGRYVHSSIKL